MNVSNFVKKNLSGTNDFTLTYLSVSQILGHVVFVMLLYLL